MTFLKINERLFPVAKTVKPDMRMSLIIYIETALGLLNLREILESGVDETNMFKLEAVVFGSDDFFANIGNFFLNYTMHMDKMTNT